MQHAAGVRLHAKRGDVVRAGQPLATLLTDDAGRLPRALETIGGAHTVAPVGTPVPDRPLVAARIS